VRRSTGERSCHISILGSRSAMGSLLFTWLIAGPLFDGDGLCHSKKACLLALNYKFFP
jgi:hypothetical protein